MSNVLPNANRLTYTFADQWARLFGEMDIEAVRKELQPTGAEYREALCRLEAARDALLPNIEKALRAGMRQVEIVHHTGYTREPRPPDRAKDRHRVRT